MGDSFPRVRVAAAQAAPVFLDRDASVEKACRLIREAGSEGAKLIGFPEGFLPTHPLWYNFYPATNPLCHRLSTKLFNNSIVIPSEATDALCAAARDGSIAVVMGLCEKQPGTTGTMHNTQLFIGEDGSILGKHQKLVATFTERLVHTGGDGATLDVFQTSFGRISGLVCGENGNPLAAFKLFADHPQVHVASWPPYGTLSDELPPAAEAPLMLSRMIAHQGKVFVINACSTVDKTLLDGLELNDDIRAKLAKEGVTGGSSIVGPDGRVLAGPMGPEEGILYADIDLEECVSGKIFHDFAGHYNRSDVFQLLFSPRKQSIISELSQDDFINKLEAESGSEAEDAEVP